MEDVIKASNDLLDTLHQTKILIEKLIESSREKESLLSSENADGLNELLMKEEDIVSVFRENEEERKSRIYSLAAAVGVSGDDLSLKEIIEFVEYPSCRKKLIKTKDEMAQKMGELIQQNAKVKELLKYKIDYTNFMINLLYVPKSNLYSYDMQGNKEDEISNLNLLDYRA